MDDFAAQVIELDSVESVKHWCATFGCNEADLMLAVHRVGPSAGAVEEYLAKATDRARGAGPGGSPGGPSPGA
jgi:hypothetical protein